VKGKSRPANCLRKWLHFIGKVDYTSNLLKGGGIP
jgi:hypothetical protein